MVIRQWELITQLGRRQRGMTIRQLIEATGVSRATLYRDLDLLCNAGAPIASERVNGEVRWKLTGASYPPLVPTALQAAALHLARTMMAPFAGTRLVAELDALLARVAPRKTAQEPVSLGPLPPGAPPKHVQTIDRALHAHKRVAFAYQSVNETRAQRRRVDPISLRLHDSQLYLLAHDIRRDDLRTFKVARIRDVEFLDEDAALHPEYDEQALFAHSAKVWTGAPVHVSVRLSPRVVRFATEWPLASGQTIEERSDGAAIIHAHVAGTVEAMRWVLRWGEDAEALSPPELRAAVHAQLTGALQCYSDRARMIKVSHEK
jgi:proteasome accessory factor B